MSYLVLPLQARGNLGAMAMKRSSTLPKPPASPEGHEGVDDTNGSQ